MEIEATITVAITHQSGPTIDDPDHIRAWIVGDGVYINGEYGGFTYQICPTHADPDECGCDGTVAVYKATLLTVED